MSNEKIPVWDLTDLYQDMNDPKIDKDIKEIKKLTAKLEKNKDIFNSKIKQEQFLFTVIKDFEKINILSLNLYAFFQLNYDINVDNQEIKSKLATTKNIIVDINARLSFLEVALTKIDVDIYNWLQKRAEFKPYLHFLKRYKLLKPYTLTEKEERIMSLSSVTGSMAWEQLWNEIAASLDFGEIEIDGKKIKATESNLGVNIVDYRRPVRQKAFKRLKGTYGQRIGLFAHAYNSIVTDHYQRSIKIRGYKAPLFPRVQAEEVTLESVNKMLTVLNSEVGVLREYNKLKAKKLRINDFKMSDLLAPLHKVDNKVSYKQAKEHINECLSGFDLDFLQLTNLFFDKNWIHAQPKPKKYSGAYMCPAEKHPYILANYQNNYNQVFTLAHELGHGVHTLLSSRKQSFLQSGTSLVIAECASQFNELLLLDYYLNNLNDKKVKENLIVSQLDDRFNALFRQSMITQFEIDMHNKIKDHGLTADLLCNHWMELSKARFGQTVNLEKEEQYGWARIMHIFHSPFYCFTYTMSMFVVLALFNMYKQDKNSFVKGYKGLLSAGQSDTPAKLLKQNLGLDMNSSDFYISGLQIIKQLLNKIK